MINRMKIPNWLIKGRVHSQRKFLNLIETFQDTDHVTLTVFHSKQHKSFVQFQKLSGCVEQGYCHCLIYPGGGETTLKNGVTRL